MAEDWSKAEVDLLVSDYLSMLAEELRGNRYNKTLHRRSLAPLLRNRSDGSIERKHQNVSAVLIALGYPYVFGYKPLSNYQGLLLDVVADRLAADKNLATLAKMAVEAPAIVPSPKNLLSRLEAPPDPVDPTDYRRLRERQSKATRIVNWLEVESRNRSLGRAGEEFAIQFERARLQRAGRSRLADQIEHTAVTEGDGTGFDIRSFEVNGKDRLIEVKTTAYGKQTPFFLSRNELTISRQKSGSYHLYRLFRFRDDPKLYGLSGAFDETCLLDPVQFAARVK